MLPQPKDSLTTGSDDPYLIKGRYFSESKIGEGGFAVISKGVDRHTEKLVAIKKIMDERMDGPSLQNEIIREVQFMIELKHKYVIRLLDIFIHDRRIMMVMPYCEWDLGKALKRSNGITFTELNILKYTKQLFEALSYIHSHGITHMDIKPGNILIGQDGNLIVTDFGLSMRYWQSINNLDPKHIDQAGTPDYMPPEKILCKYRNINRHPAVDVWAAGLVIAEMITRTPLIERRTDNGITWDDLTSAVGWPSPEARVAIPEYETFGGGSGAFISGIRRAGSTALDQKLSSENIGPDLHSLLVRCFDWNPKTRITVDEVLKLPFIAELDADGLPSPFDKNGADDERDLLRVIVEHVDILSGNREREVAEWLGAGDGIKLLGTSDEEGRSEKDEEEGSLQQIVVPGLDIPSWFFPTYMKGFVTGGEE